MKRAYAAMMKRGAFRTPASPGAVVLAALLACLALEAATLGDRLLGIPPLLAHALFGGTAVVSALAADALWNERPWASRAIQLWAVALPIASGIAVAAVGGYGGAPATLLRGSLTLLATGIPCFAVAAWVRRRVAGARIARGRP